MIEFLLDETEVQTLRRVLELEYVRDLRDERDVERYQAARALLRRLDALCYEHGIDHKTSPSRS